MKKFLVILFIIGLALIGLSSIKTTEVPIQKPHEEHWEEVMQELQKTFDLSDEEVIDLQPLVSSDTQIFEDPD